MTQLDSTIIAGAVSALGVVIAAWLTLRGKREETAQERAAHLIDSQGRRMEAMEARQDRMQRDIDELRSELSQANRLVDVLARALESAVRTIREVRDWIDGGTLPPPPRLEVEWLEHALAEAARPRRPPEDGD